MSHLQDEDFTGREHLDGTIWGSCAAMLTVLLCLLLPLFFFCHCDKEPEAPLPAPVVTP